MTPVVIASPGGACFGMYRAASGPAVLMLPPFGDEGLKTARFWRNLALELAEHGLATLRFDLPGTGNSAGEATEPGRVVAWRAAIRACATWLADRHDGRLMLFGHRFGALMALDAVASGVSAERVALLDPPMSGAALVRHLRARARMEGFGPPPEGPDYIQAGGVPLSAATLHELATLPAPIPGSDFPPALLVLNDNAMAPSPWPDRLRASGSLVETMPFEGFDEFVRRDAFRAEAPVAVLREVVTYLAKAAAPVDLNKQVAVPSTTALRLDGLTETPIDFGPADAMFGILCRPDCPVAGAPAMLLPTTGIDPCSGLSRMWTDLARNLAHRGITSLRFDMTGVGESQGRFTGDPMTASYHPDRIADLSSAVDALGAQGFGQVTVVGYCSGAYAAWHAAIKDKRIGGLLAGNLVFLNLQTMLADDVLRLQPGSSRLGLRQGSIARLLPARGMKVLRRLDDRVRGAIPRPVRHFLRGWEADQKQTRRHVRALTARGCAVSIVMAEDDHGHVRLRRAFGEQPRLPTGVELTVIADTDHQFSDRRHRAHFLELAAAFVLGRSSVGLARPVSIAGGLPALLTVLESL